jgi:hypothetical protein
MAEKRRSGIPRLVSKTRVSNFEVNLHPLPEQATSNDDNGRLLENDQVSSCHTLNVEIDEHARKTLASVQNLGHPVVARSKVLVHKKENVSETQTAKQIAEESGSKFKPPTGRVSTHTISHKYVLSAYVALQRLENGFEPHLLSG